MLAIDLRTRDSAVSSQQQQIAPNATRAAGRVGKRLGGRLGARRATLGKNAQPCAMYLQVKRRMCDNSDGVEHDTGRIAGPVGLKVDPNRAHNAGPLPGKDFETP